ncbi:MAG: sodium:proton antiporter [Flavobacteriales bacterium]|nr:sodium:proton antiporter [Flavobacteriales bacterium]|tara:strand:- start:7006 stop:8292 length:1287 start_codon:yes stop_codon:yes gene_type:complete
MEIFIITIFCLGYLAIALEHPIKIDKAATALITGVTIWTFYVISGETHENIHDNLLHHLSEISQILFFLLGAMTIVELVDVHKGFSVITDKIKTNNKLKLLWIVCILTFFFSAALDNLTTSIVMVSLLRKLIDNKNDRWFFAGMVVIAANAGGAWSPMGDVTTTMLWIGGQLTTLTIIKTLFVPSVFALLVPLTIVSIRTRGNIKKPKSNIHVDEVKVSNFEKKLLFISGLVGLLFVPIFKTFTHLPPFMGMMFSLGILWMITEILHKNKKQEIRLKLNVISVFKKIDLASILFFLGILLAVAGLDSLGYLKLLANNLETFFNGNIYSINIVIGLLSAIVDNVPLVAGSMSMYEIVENGPFSQNGVFWQFLAYCAGTGGSALIIGSAAGVAVMGLEKIDFIWYVKNISILALTGYLSGCIVYILINFI